MPEFIDPFKVMTPARKMSNRELSRAIRVSLAAELEAIHLYEAYADATENELARKVLQDIADEERVHAGEFQRLINILLADEEGLLAEGAGEVNEMAEELGEDMGATEDEAEEVDATPRDGKEPKTIGNLKGESK